MITWDETKRQINIQKHDAIDLAELGSAFDYPMVTKEDTRTAYDEIRLQSLCWHNNRVAFLVWTERDDSADLISCRYGDKNETRKYFKEIGY